MITDIVNKMLSVDCGTHHTVYDGDVLGGCGRGEVGDPQTFVPDVWKDVVEKYDIKSVLDVGCGYGYSVKWFEERGLDAHGLEGSLKIVEECESASVDVHDFREGRPNFLLSKEYDLGWCSEFLEHVDARYEPCYMDALVRCRHLLVTAAAPGFGGHHHVNEQPPEYWIERFQSHGFEFLQDEANRLRELAHDQHPNCYFQSTGLFFRRVKQVRPRTHWTDLDGGPATMEAEYLQDRARGRRVLVIGGGVGQYALAIGETAKQVTCVDVIPEDLGDLLANVRTAGMDGRVEVTSGPADSGEIAARRFDMVVIDTPLAKSATNLAARVILPGGIVAWAGWRDENVRTQALLAGIKPGSVAWLGDIGILETAKWQVMITLPHSRSVELQSYKSLRMASLGRFTAIAAEMDMACGSLTHNFNTLLAQSLDWRDRGKVTHMAMIHSDITAERGWLDLLAEEMHTHGLVVNSGVIAIKDPDQDRTSTAIGSKANPWEPLRYIHLRDRDRMPVTFTGRDVCKEDDEVLLINTGLMLIDLRHEFWDDFIFVVLNRIARSEDGKRQPQFRPEDWEMSRELDRAGLPYGSTWRPFAEHLGGTSWPNRAPVTQVIHNA